MRRSPIRLPRGGPGLFDIFSTGRLGRQGSGGFNRDQIEVISRTVHRAPEVMVKVTGGGAKVGGVAAHLAYISREGELEIEADHGGRVTDSEEQAALLDSWHLDLSAGQYRRPRAGQTTARTLKLTHHLVLSMPAPTPPDKVLAAARKFARENFALQHRYAMVLHTDQKHPHVHLVVKTESERGKRLHIDKEKLHHWREDFARLMREQGIAANATPRAVRGRNKGRTLDGVLRSQRRGGSRVLRDRVMAIAEEISQTGTVRDSAHGKVLETRKAIAAYWMKTAEVLDAQGEVVLAGEVRQFARRLPPALTDKELLAAQFMRHYETHKPSATKKPEHARDRAEDLSR